MSDQIKFLDSKLSDDGAPAVEIKKLRHWPKSWHVFDSDSVWAINAALASRRPLLIRGEPGSGKSQLARAAAQELGRAFLCTVVNARFEPEDLLYRFDAVARLAKAQTMRAADKSEEHLAANLFLLPEVLWWGLNPRSAAKQFGDAAPHCGLTAETYDASACGAPLDSNTGAVVLIDEIDKADSEVPNSLLETLSLGGFQKPYGGESVYSEGVPPLIIITTNEDRELPPAFVRRCLVLHMDLPEDVGDNLDNYLLRRVEAHSGKEKDQINVDSAVVQAAIKQLKLDRAEMKSRELTPPGQAELIDLLSAISRLAKGKTKQMDALGRLQRFAFAKHRQL